MLVEDWPSAGGWKNATLNKLPYWVRLFGFPTNALTKANVEKFGALAGEVVVVPWSNVNRILLNGYARLKIKFPVDQPVYLD